MALEFAREMREICVAREEGGFTCGIDTRIQKILGTPKLHFVDIGDRGVAEEFAKEPAEVFRRDAAKGGKMGNALRFLGEIFVDVVNGGGNDAVFALTLESTAKRVVFSLLLFITDKSKMLLNL